MAAHSSGFAPGPHSRRLVPAARSQLAAHEAPVYFAVAAFHPAQQTFPVAQLLWFAHANGAPPAFVHAGASPQMPAASLVVMQQTEVSGQNLAGSPKQRMPAFASAPASARVPVLPLLEPPLPDAPLELAPPEVEPPLPDAPLELEPPEVEPPLPDAPLELEPPELEPPASPFPKRPPSAGELHPMRSANVPRATIRIAPVYARAPGTFPSYALVCREF